jgi:hypothetical protein
MAFAAEVQRVSRGGTNRKTGEPETEDILEFVVLIHSFPSLKTKQFCHGERQGNSQLFKGTEGRRANSPLDVADAINGDACCFGQLLLSEVPRPPKLS